MESSLHRPAFLVPVALRSHTSFTAGLLQRPQRPSVPLRRPSPRRRVPHPSLPISYPVTATLVTDAQHLPPPTQPLALNVVVWLRPGDLRVRDHPGLNLATFGARDAVACLYLPRGLPGEAREVARVRQGLRARGGELFVRMRRPGEAEAEAVLKFVKEVEAERVYVSAAAVGWQEVCAVEKEVEVVQWADDVWQGDAWTEAMPHDYVDFLKQERASENMLLGSSVAFEPQVLVPGPPSQVLDSPGEIGTESLDEDVGGIQQRFDNDSKRLGVVTLNDADDNSEIGPENLVRQYLEAMERYEKIDFGRTFAPIFTYGSVSPRRIRELVVSHEREHGRLFPIFYRQGARTVLNALKVRQFHSKLAYRDVSTNSTVDGTHSAKYWSWNGYLGRYVVEGDPSKPAMLLIHGFGASSQHWGRNVDQLKHHFQVFCLDLIGFGRSEKPVTRYTQYLWECYIRDFVLQVIGRRTYIAGNSIGGYLSMAFAADTYPHWNAGVILVNPAGRLDLPASSSAASNNSSLPNSKTQPKSIRRYILEEFRFARLALGNFLLFYLRRGIKPTLQRIYQQNPAAASAELAAEIFRNSRDHGAVEVLSSGFILPEPRSLTTLAENYPGPVLVFQGRFDGLSRPVERAQAIKQLCPGAEVQIVDAGHCPHDEVPQLFNRAVTEWVKKLERVDDTAPTASVESNGLHASVPDDSQQEKEHEFSLS